MLGSNIDKYTRLIEMFWFKEFFQRFFKTIFSLDLKYFIQYLDYFKILTSFCIITIAVTITHLPFSK